jgi:hypothetical protein
MMVLTKMPSSSIMVPTYCLTLFGKPLLDEETRETGNGDKVLPVHEAVSTLGATRHNI